MNEEKVLERIVAEIKKNVDIAIVGLSGGADSLLVTLVSAEALGTENVFTVGMPYCSGDKAGFNKNSDRWARHLGVNHRMVSIEGTVNRLNAMVQDAVGEFVGGEMTVLNRGNTRSRVRMCTLYGIAHHLGDTLGKRARVMGTGNLSEDFIGYDTKGGDALGDLFPIGHLLKHEVYRMLEFFRDRGDITEAMINRRPSAGLWDGQCDEEELGYTYDTMAPAIEWLFDGRAPETYPGDPAVLRFVQARHLANRHKHQAPPVVPLRDLIGPATEWGRSCSQAEPALRAEPGASGDGVALAK